MSDYHARMASLYMHRAIDADDVATVHALLANGYPVNIPSLRGYLPLLQAVIGGHAAVVRALLEHGADPKVADMALIRAVQNGDRSIVEMLLAAGARINAADAQGKTALDAAREAGDPELVTLLLPGT